ncbi:MAG: retropepsin-like aspartic protease [Pseudomonadota bacterium]
MADYPYRLDGELIIVPVKLRSKTDAYNGMFVLDTGSSGIIIDHEIAFDLGYTAKDGVGFSTVSSAVGKEKGYRLLIDAFEVFGKKLNSIEVRCHDLKDQGVEGLIGMSFLKRFNWCVYPKRQVISIK